MSKKDKIFAKNENRKQKLRVQQEKEKKENFNDYVSWL